MNGEFNSSRNRTSGSILASALVFFTGALGVAFVTAAGGGDPLLTLLVLGGCAIAFVGILLLLKGASQFSMKSAYQWVFSKNARPESEYQPKARRQSSSVYGTNRPPSAEDVRELKDDARNWVPSHGSRGRKNLRDE